MSERKGQRSQNQGPGLQTSPSFPNVQQGTVCLTSESLMLPQGVTPMLRSGRSGNHRLAYGRRPSTPAGRAAFVNISSMVPFRTSLLGSLTNQS